MSNLLSLQHQPCAPLTLRSMKRLSRRFFNIPNIYPNSIPKHWLPLCRSESSDVAVASNTGVKSPREVLREVIKGMVENEDIAAVVEKYNLEEELFADIDFVQVNAFTFSTFGGNPAAVVYLPLMRADSWLLSVSKEFNLSETAYLVRRRPKMAEAPDTSQSKTRGFGAKTALIQPSPEGDSLNPVKKVVPPTPSYEFDLRWFTPSTEVALCGHATLASAHFLYSTFLVPSTETVVFHTKSGALKASKINPEESIFAPLLQPSPASSPTQPPSAAKGKGRPKGGAIYQLDFPLDELQEISGTDSALVGEALPGVDIVWMGRTALGNILVELASEEQVRALEPQLDILSRIQSTGVGVTAVSSRKGGYDFVSRYFAPRVGINEDPATGSLQCSLAPYWSKKLAMVQLIGKQVSERGGLFGLKVDEEERRVYLQGSAVLTMAGALMNTATVTKDPV